MYSRQVLRIKRAGLRLLPKTTLFASFQAKKRSLPTATWDESLHGHRAFSLYKGKWRGGEVSPLFTNAHAGFTAPKHCRNSDVFSYRHQNKQLRSLTESTTARAAPEARRARIMAAQAADAGRIGGSSPLHGTVRTVTAMPDPKTPPWGPQNSSLGVPEAAAFRQAAWLRALGGNNRSPDQRHGRVRRAPGVNRPFPVCL